MGFIFSLVGYVLWVEMVSFLQAELTETVDQPLITDRGLPASRRGCRQVCAALHVDVTEHGSHETLE